MSDVDDDREHGCLNPAYGQRRPAFRVLAR